MQMTIERRKAYTEILEIINFLGKSYYNKLPNTLVDYFKDNSEKNYEFKINPSNEMTNQIQNPITINLLGLLRYKYWCNSAEEKNTLFKTFKNNDEKKEKIMQEKYSYNNLFKTKKIQQEQPKTQNTSLVTYNDSIFYKFLKKFKQLFLKNK